MPDGQHCSMIQLWDSAPATGLNPHRLIVTQIVATLQKITAEFHKTNLCVLRVSAVKTFARMRAKVTRLPAACKGCPTCGFCHNALLRTGSPSSCGWKAGPRLPGGVAPDSHYAP
jgi:hypothetical protein